MLYKYPRPHPLTPSPAGEGELNLLLPSPGGRGAGGEGETLQLSGFHVKLKRMGTALPLQLSVPHQRAICLQQIRKYYQMKCTVGC